MISEHPPEGEPLSPAQLLEINRICDPFERGWRSGQRPLAEALLGEAAGPSRAALLRELLAIEIEARIAIGERPQPPEYLARFPGHRPVVEAAFARLGIAPEPPDAAPGLLLGLLALQNNFVDRDALLAAFNAWIADKTRPLGALLVERGALDGIRHGLLEALVAEHLKQNDHDPGRILAALAAGGSTREWLRQAHDSGVLESAVIDLAAAGFTLGPAADGVRFRVIRSHARGGLGEVFVAMDGELNREVALKEILGDHAHDPSSRARFVLEAEVTGGLEHPGIVPVYGLGAHPDGRPYYAMRFIKGDNLKKAVAAFHGDESLKHDPGRRSLDLAKLLRRFLDICNAIDYAHSRGVLHRDIKPANVIVGKYGETLVVDWGLAKSSARREPGTPADEQTLRPASASGGGQTQRGAILGTPAFMSPEQASGDPDKLGPRSDVYGLGATLYFLLTNKPPVTGATIDDTLQAVRAGTITPPRFHDPTIDRALESVCLKALSLKPEGRYESARNLSEDIERWLTDEPVTSYREPTIRRARRWAKRHRMAVTGATVALLVGLASLGVLAAMQARANWSLKKANRATEMALAESEESRKQAEAVGDFLVDAFRSPNPSLDGSQIKVADLLDRAAKKLDGKFEGSQATRVAMVNALGQTYSGLGLYERAEASFAKALALGHEALGRRHPWTLASHNNLAMAYLEAGRTEEAIAAFESALKYRRLTLGPDHLSTLISQNNLASAYQRAGRTAEAMDLEEDGLRRSEMKFGADHRLTQDCRNNLAQDYIAAGRTSEAIALHEQTLKSRQATFGPDHPVTLTSRHNLAAAYVEAGRTSEAIPIFEETIRLRGQKLGDDHPDTLETLSHLATIYSSIGRTSQAIAIHETILKHHLALFVADHPNVLAARNNLASAFRDAGRTSEAIPLFELNLKLREKRLGANHGDTLISRSNLGEAYASAGLFAEAIPIFETTLRLSEDSLGVDHPSTMQTRNNLAASYGHIRRIAEALALHERNLKLREKKLGVDHPDTLKSRNNLAEAYRLAGRIAAAVAMDEGTLKLRAAKLGLDHPDTLIGRNNLALSYLMMGRGRVALETFAALLPDVRRVFKPAHPNTLNITNNYANTCESLGLWSDAEPLRREVLARRRENPQGAGPALVSSLATLARNLGKQGEWSQAEPLLRECLSFPGKPQPPAWLRFDVMTQLGEALAAQGKFPEAEPLVISGYRGLRGLIPRIPLAEVPRLVESAERVVHLYEAWGKPDQAAEWRSRLGLADLPAKVFAPDLDRRPGR